MPKKLMDCIEKVKASGKSEEEAWAICRKSTGLKPHRESCSICEIIALADRLDDAGLQVEAASLDNLVEKEAQWNWAKEKGQQLKDWFQTEKEQDPKKRQILTNIRKTHWDLINKINKAYQLLNNAGKSMNDPQTYARDLGQVVDVLQRDLGTALQNSQQQAEQAAAIADQATGQHVQEAPQSVVQPGVDVQQGVERYKQLQEQYPGAGRTEQAPAPKEAPTERMTYQGHDPQTGQPIYVDQTGKRVQPPAVQRGAEWMKRQQYTVMKLLRLANKLDQDGKRKIADQIDVFLTKAQLGWTKELGTQMGDKFRANVGIIDENVRQQHYKMMERLKNLYNHLQGLRRSVTSPDYPAQFQAAIQNAQEEFKALMVEAKEIQQELGTSQATPEEQPAQEQSLTEENLDANIQEALKTLTPEQKQKVLKLMQNPQGQGV